MRRQDAEREMEKGDRRKKRELSFPARYQTHPEGCPQTPFEALGRRRNPSVTCFVVRRRSRLHGCANKAAVNVMLGCLRTATRACICLYSYLGVIREHLSHCTCISSNYGAHKSAFLCACSESLHRPREGGGFFVRAFFNA